MRHATVAELMEHGERPDFVHISKVGAGYVYRKDTDYRCADCWKFIPQTERCVEFGPGKRVLATGYCINWSPGERVHFLPPMGSYQSAQLGYGEDPRGTKCGRCKHFDGLDACEIVEGRIDRDACCNNQEPR
jgi:hypothetical protein